MARKPEDKKDTLEAYVENQLGKINFNKEQSEIMLDVIWEVCGRVIKERMDLYRQSLQRAEIHKELKLHKLVERLSDANTLELNKLLRILRDDEAAKEKTLKAKH